MLARSKRSTASTESIEVGGLNYIPREGTAIITQVISHDQQDVEPFAGKNLVTQSEENDRNYWKESHGSSIFRYRRF